jgi:hypothetical protein
MTVKSDATPCLHALMLNADMNTFERCTSTRAAEAFLERIKILQASLEALSEVKMGRGTGDRRAG